MRGEVMGKQVGWSIEDVWEYFGELFIKRKDFEEKEKVIKEQLKLLMEAIDADMPSTNYWAKMHKMREILMKHGHEVPFRAVYRHKKGE
jgi:uncharacterized protein with HEPN domain